MTDPDRPPHILILGGGAGGLELAIRLAKATGCGRTARVTLADPSPAHLWKPRLHEIAVGLLVAAEERAGYAEQAASHGFSFVLGAADRVDADARTVSIAAVADAEGGDLLPARTIAFDTLVLAIGSTINDFNTPGVGEHAFTLDTPDGAERLHRAILDQAARVAAGLQDGVHVAIVGAGTTGVELAADLRSASGRLAQYRSLIAPGQLRVTLVEMADRPLPGVATDTSAYARRLLAEQRVETIFGARVNKVERGRVDLADGGSVAADLVVWASGVRARALPISPAPRVEGAGRLRVDEALRLVAADGRVLPHVYALGDVAACVEPGHDQPVGATAQAAHQQAHLLARSIAGQLHGRPPLPFRYRYRGTLVSLGSRQAVGDVPARGASFRITGLTAKLAYRALYRAHLLVLFGWRRTAALALSALLRRSARPSVKLHW